MNLRKTSRLFAIAAVMLLLTAGWARDVQAQEPQTSAPQAGPGPLGTGFTYQGELKNSGSPVTGLCDFNFSLWDSSGSGIPPTGGTLIGAADVQTNVPVTNGLFTVTLNAGGQFTVQAFQGDLRYLQIAVRCPAGSGSYTTLGPRQSLTAAPYAMGLMPGTRMLGDSYQTLKIQNDTTLTGNPAGVTGEMLNSMDGVGVYGSSNVTTAGATGMGVWGRTYSPNGIGVNATAYNGAIGVKATSNGNGI